MFLIQKAELRELAERTGSPAVSLFLPTHRVTAHTEQDRIRLKNLLQQAELRLRVGGHRSSDVRDLLEPAQRLHEDSLFWEHQSDGLAIFLAPGFERHYCLPLVFSDLVVVSDGFHVKPLIQLFTGDGRFYVLAVSQKSVRLMEGTRYSVSEVDLEGVPESLAEALKFDEFEKQLQFHTRAPERGGERAGMFHGHGKAHGEDPKNQLLRYFRQIDHGLQDLLRSERIPLVLAGVDYYLPIYREASTYPHLVDEPIAGNPEQLSAEELHKKAWEVLAPHFKKGQEGALALYKQLAGTGRTSSNVNEIVPAAYQGRVEFLFVALGQQRWGNYDPASNTVMTHKQQEPGDRDLLDIAAVTALFNGATVYAVSPEAVPNGTAIAAVFRH